LLLVEIDIVEVKEKVCMVQWVLLPVVAGFLLLGLTVLILAPIYLPYVKQVVRAIRERIVEMKNMWRE